MVRDTTGTITSTIGRYYMNSKKYQFVNNVKLVNPEYVIESNQLDFYTLSGFAFLFGPTTITSETSVIYCERGFYDTQNDTGYFVKKSKINYDERVVEGDSIYFDRTKILHRLPIILQSRTLLTIQLLKVIMLKFLGQKILYL